MTKKKTGLTEEEFRELEKGFTEAQKKEFADGRGEDEDDGDQQARDV